MKVIFAVPLFILSASGCASTPPAPVAAPEPHQSTPLQSHAPIEPAELLAMDQANTALVEWQAARLATTCDDVARQTTAPVARREAMRLKATYTASTYSIVSGPNPLVQVLSLTALATLSQQIWVEEHRAASVFGPHAQEMEEMLSEISTHTKAHARRYLSEMELQSVEDIVRAWRKANPDVTTPEYIRFEAFADDLARSLSQRSSSDDLFVRIKDAVREVEGMRMLGERALYLASRMPRLAQWHAQAVAADLLAQPEVGEILSALRQVGSLQRELPAQIRGLEARLTTMPAALTETMANQPVMKRTLANIDQTSQHTKSIESGVGAIEKAMVTDVHRKLEELTAVTQPDSVLRIAGDAGGRISGEARSLIFLATGCATGVVILYGLLRRWSNQPLRSV